MSGKKSSLSGSSPPNFRKEFTASDLQFLERKKQETLESLKKKRMRPASLFGRNKLFNKTMNTEGESNARQR